MFTPEDELDVIHQDLGKARRKLDSLLRAPFEKRWCGTDAEHEVAVARAVENVRELERELRLARYEQEAALDAQDAA